MKKTYENDFIGPELKYCANNKIKIDLNYDNLLKNDRRFLEFIEGEAVRIDEYYQLALPLKYMELVLPNNRMAPCSY